MKGKGYFLSFVTVCTVYFLGILIKLCILVYNLKIMANCRKFFSDKIYALFGVNYFGPEIMVV